MRAQGGEDGKMAIYKSRREASAETNPVDTFISIFYLTGLWENNLLLFKPPVCGTFYDGSTSKLIRWDWALE